MIKMVKVYCGFYIGDYKWKNTEHYEPDECIWEDVLEIEWNNEENCPNEWLKCGYCGQSLEDSSHYEVVNK